MLRPYYPKLLCSALLLLCPFLAWADDEPVPAPPAQPEALYIDGTDIIANAEAIETLSCVKGGTVSYDSESKTLTLDNATLLATSEYIIDSEVQGLTIRLLGASTITAGCLRLADTDIIGADGSSLIASGTCYILARHRTLSVSTTYMKLNGGGYAAIDNRGGSLTVTDADIIIQQGGPAILTATATLTDCTATSSVPGGVAFDAEAGTFKAKGSSLSALNIVATHHREDPHLNITPAQTEFQVFAGSEQAFVMPTVSMGFGWDGTLVYTSSNPDVISITADGQPTFHTLGTTTITVTAPATDAFISASANFSITYVKNTPVLYFSATEVTLPYTTTAFRRLPTLTYQGNGKVTLTSSNTDVLMVDVLNGVHLMGVGKATITATVPETDTYYSATAAYTCTVSEPPTPKPSNIHWTNFSGTQLDVQVGSENQYYSGYPVAECVVGYDGFISYTSSDPRCVQVDPTYGSLTFMAPGTVTITATAPATDYFTESSISYVVHYFEPAPDPVQIAMSFPASDYTVLEGQEADFVQPMLNITPAAYDGIITYASSDPDCIRVDAHTGQLTFVALGTATITATGSTTDLYIGDGVSASYTISYEEAPDLRPVPQLAFTTSEADVAYMPDGTVKVPLLMLQYNGTEPLTFSSSDQQVVSTDADGTLYITGREGTATITVTSAESDQWKAAESALLIRVADQTAVGVKGMANSGRKQDSYDLSGRKQTRNTPRGIFITAGRKVATR